MTQAQQREPVEGVLSRSGSTHSPLTGIAPSYDTAAIDAGACDEFPSLYPRYYPEGLKTVPLIHGECAAGWESMRRVFQENFEKRLERGAAVCVYYKGEKVVDLWAGEKYLGVPWTRDTIVNCFSVTKGMASLGLALLHSRGLLDYDAPVCRYWPEFAAHGKERLTVRELLAHAAGVCVVDQKITLEDIADHRKLGMMLASTKMEWGPEARKNGYMGLTIGWHEDQLCRRIDPQNRSIADFVRDEITSKIGMRDEFFIGLPPPSQLPRHRVAALNAFSKFDMGIRGKYPAEFIKNFVLRPSSYAARTFQNPPALGDVRKYASEEVRRLVVPGGNGHASARAVAAAYDAVLAAGRASPGKAAKAVGFSKATLDELTGPATPQYDEVMRTETAFRLGFAKSYEDGWLFGSSDRAFGCPGVGGSLGIADPDADVAFAYVTNDMGLHMFQDPRELALRAEAYEIVKALGGKSRRQTPDPALQLFIDKGNVDETTCCDPLLRQGAWPWVLMFAFVCLVAIWLSCGYKLQCIVD